VGHPLAGTGSLWADGLDEADARAGEGRPPLEGSTEADVAIVGGGYTGLWAALHLLRIEPSMRIVVLESEVCGFGASGRNGGWASAFFAGSREATAKRHGRDAAVALQRAMHHAVDDLGTTAAEEGIDCAFYKGGSLVLATTAQQEPRVRAMVEYEHGWGFTDDDVRWLDADEATKRITATGVRGAKFTPHCARVHPARLVRGLAAAVEGRGAVVHEGTRVTRIEPGRAVTANGAVRAPIVVRATEGYTPELDGARRAMVPLQSLMIATAPLPEEAWDRVGWSEAETFTDGRRLIIYAQRTADDRIAFGGRGAPYRFGSRVVGSAEGSPKVWAALEATLRDLLPGIGDAAVTHRWGGSLGVPRDWYSSVGIDRETGLAWGGGYVGDGVTTAYLAGRTLADLVLERSTELTTLPWVGHRSPSWEPEPLRWLGINAGLWLAASADRYEERTGHTSAWRDRALQSLVG
jgi:glycine/D-amino acid oxidase-like deaminating enzyme